MAGADTVSCSLVSSLIIAVICQGISLMSYSTFFMSIYCKYLTSKVFLIVYFVDALLAGQIEGASPGGRAKELRQIEKY